MTIQTIVVIAILAAAFAYALSTLFKKRKAFSTKASCGNDCGCSESPKKLPS